MPELPEVETTKNSILPHLQAQKIVKIMVRQKKLRWPISSKLIQEVVGAKIVAVARRAKYLLIQTNKGTILIHLGMSGHLRILSHPLFPGKHDHVDLCLSNGKYLRFTDPRRFGAWLWTTAPYQKHSLLKHLGPEPLTTEFCAAYLHKIANKRKITVKQFIMDNQVVVGVGNIYASEALFLAGIHPKTVVNILLLEQWEILVEKIQYILQRAIQAGGTTVRNFLHGENAGKPGYFAQQLWVYGRQGQPCKICATILGGIKIGQRSTVFCPCCQPGC